MFFKGDDDRPEVRTLPLLPLRDIIVFPHMVVPLFVGRDKSIRSLEEAMAGSKDVLLAAQKLAKTNEPRPEDIFPVGTIGTIIQLLRLPDGTVKVLIEGKRRARIKRFTETRDVFRVEVESHRRAGRPHRGSRRPRAADPHHLRGLRALNKRIPPEMQVAMTAIDDPAKLADSIVAHLNLKLTDKQTILETHDPVRPPGAAPSS
jgi:ATP-dependent Lon protease